LGKAGLGSVKCAETIGGIKKELILK